MLCVEMHRRYPTFADALIRPLLSCVNSPPGSGGGGPADVGMGRRVCFRLLTEFLLHGIIADAKPIAKIVNEATGAPPAAGGIEEGKYAVTDANLIVTLAKSGGNEILGVVPRSVRETMERLKKEEEGRGEGSLVLVLPEEDTAAVTTTTTAEGGDAQKKAEPVPSVDLSAPFVASLYPPLREKCQRTLAAFRVTASTSRAVPPTTATTLHRHCLGAYHTLARSYISTHRRLLKLEKRCEQDRLLQGNLSEAREKGLQDARSLMESLTKSVEALSEALDAEAPTLEEEEAMDDEATDGKGIELWTKNVNDTGNEQLGPFDDEETRSFYCDVPDLLSIKPPALLGINPIDFEKQKERNLRQYGGNTAEGEDVDVGDMTMDDADSGGGGDGTELKKESSTEANEELEDAITEDGEDPEKGETGRCILCVCVCLFLFLCLSPIFCL